MIPLLAVARRFVTELDAANLPDARLSTLQPAIDSLAEHLGAGLGRADAAGDQPPVWLDVAAPAHGQVNVAGVRTAFSAGHVTTADSATVVTANDCTLHTESHYHVRRVSLDCSSLYNDEEAMAAFIFAMQSPTPRNIARLTKRLGQIVEPQDHDTNPQLHRGRLPHKVATRTERAGTAVLGDGSIASSTTKYHIRETVVPLTELLWRRPRLIRDLAQRHEKERLGEPILAALGEVADPDLLRHATRLPSRSASVTHSLGGTRVRLADAVMVGYGNTLVATSRVDRGRTKAGNLPRFDSLVAKARNEIRRDAPAPARVPHQAGAAETPGAPRRLDRSDRGNVTRGTMPPPRPAWETPKRRIVPPPQIRPEVRDQTPGPDAPDIGGFL